MNETLVAITQRRDPTGPPHDETRDALDIRLAGFVLAVGALPVPIPSALDTGALTRWLAALSPSGIVLSGGADIDADPERDVLERTLLDHARERRLPLLGVCRGMQMMAVAAGGALVAVESHVARPHDVTGNIARRVNSFHTRALRSVPPGYRCLARAPDDTVEAIAHRDLPWEGWMWHPERADRFDPADIARFREMFE